MAMRAKKSPPLFETYQSTPLPACCQTNPWYSLIILNEFFPRQSICLQTAELCCFVHSSLLIPRSSIRVGGPAYVAVRHIKKNVLWNWREADLGADEKRNTWYIVQHLLEFQDWFLWLVVSSIDIGLLLRCAWQTLAQLEICSEAHFTPTWWAAVLLSLSSLYVFLPCIKLCLCVKHSNWGVPHEQMVISH